MSEPPPPPNRAAEPDPAMLDRVFGALADPVRRDILKRLDGEDLLVTELAAPFKISLQAVSRHIQVLVRASLVTQERTGRISRCRLDARPILEASLWLNRYSRYWQSQSDTLAMWLDSLSPPPHKENRLAVPRDKAAADGRLAAASGARRGKPRRR